MEDSDIKVILVLLGKEFDVCELGKMILNKENFIFVDEGDDLLVIFEIILWKVVEGKIFFLIGWFYLGV